MRFKVYTLITCLFCLATFLCYSQANNQIDKMENAKENTATKKMQIEIWSDVMCPFCYIGKRKFDKALEEFENKDQLEIIWKSFQLSPNMKTDATKNINQFLAEHKGVSIQEAKCMNENVTIMAKQAGLVYNFDNTVVANSFDAHRFSHLAKKYGKQSEAEEKLFAAYFTEGKNIADHAVLIQLGVEIGLDAAEVESVLKSDAYAADVEQDKTEAQQANVRGVPYFWLDKKFIIAGAQDSKLILKTLQKSFAVWQKNNTPATITE